MKRRQIQKVVPCVTSLLTTSDKLPAAVLKRSWTHTDMSLLLVCYKGASSPSPPVLPFVTLLNAGGATYDILEHEGRGMDGIALYSAKVHHYI